MDGYHLAPTSIKASDTSSSSGSGGGHSEFALCWLMEIGIGFENAMKFFELNFDPDLISLSC